MKVDQNYGDGFLISCQKGLILSWMTIGLIVKPNGLIEQRAIEYLGKYFSTS